MGPAAQMRRDDVCWRAAGAAAASAGLSGDDTPLPRISQPLLGNTVTAGTAGIYLHLEVSYYSRSLYHIGTMCNSSSSWSCNTRRYCTPAPSKRCELQTHT